MTNIKNIPIILIGCGKMGRNHLRALHSNLDFQIIGVVDPQITSLPSEYHQYPLFRTLDECTDHFEAAVISVPTKNHYDVGMKLLELKKHLLVEKPLALNVEQACTLKEAAIKNDVLLKVGHLERLNPAVLKLKEILNSGWLGKPIHFSFTRVGGYPEFLSNENNVLIDLAVHDIDVLQFLIGQMDVVAGVGHSTWKPNILDTAEILMKNKEGISASIHVNWITPTKIRTLRVTGTRGVCFVDYVLQTCYMLGGELLQKKEYPDTDFTQFVNMYKNSDRVEFNVQQHEPLKLQLCQFAEALKNRGAASKLCSPDEAISTIKLAQTASLLIAVN